jgi:hypothetical protein
MNDGRNSDWRRLLQEVLTETDKAKLEKKAEELENALFVRGQELPPDGAAEEERQDMNAATQKLLRIKVEKLGFPLDVKFLGGAGLAGESKK